MVKIKRKLILSVLAIFLYSIIFINGSVNAKNITIDELIDASNNNFKIVNNNYNDGGYRQVLDKSKKTIKLYKNQDLIGIIDYTDEYLLYDEDKYKIDSSYSRSNRNFDMFNLIPQVYIEALFNLIGSTDHLLLLNEMSTLNNYEKYGLSNIVNEKVLNEETSPDENTIILESSKISLDTEKIKLLLKDYTKSQEQMDNELEESVVAKTRPVIAKVDIKENKISFVTGIDSDSKKEFHCDIYRSTTGLDGDMIKINTKPILCDYKTVFSDEDIKSNTTYYYKARIIENNNFGDLKTIKSKDSLDVKNPQTSVNSWNLLFILSISLFVGSLYLRKHNLFKKL